MPVASRSSDCSISSACCCVMPIVFLASNQVHGILHSHNSLAQHRAIDAGKSLMSLHDVAMHLRRRLCCLRGEWNHHAASIAFHDMNGHVIADLDRLTYQRVLEKQLASLPTQVEPRANG